MQPSEIIWRAKFMRACRAALDQLPRNFDHDRLSVQIVLVGYSKADPAENEEVEYSAILQGLIPENLYGAHWKALQDIATQQLDHLAEALEEKPKPN